ncbi:MAG: hypothetical protein JRI97_06600 [Deltaproteobacteria bacterium]|nr:hypothetical protein [Deltaproteobacteria bacterium]
MDTEQSLDFKEERLKDAQNAGLIGFWSRWSRKKALHTKRRAACEKGSDKLSNANADPCNGSSLERCK